MYIVKEIKVGNPLIEGEESRWGVFIDIKDELNEGKSDPLGNLVCMCCCEINALKIAEVLEVDEYINEMNFK